MNDKRQIKYNTNDPDAKGNAYFAVVLAGMAYKSQAEIEKELVDVGYKDTKVLFFRSALAAGFIVEWDDVLAIAFRGSTTWQEWLNNLNFWPKFTSYGRIHAGFSNTIDSIGPTIYSMILPGLLSGSKVVLTGHSRGGALAALFAYFLAINGYKAHAVYTFGSPKFGTGEFFDFFEGDGPREFKEPSPISDLNAALMYVATLVSTTCFLIFVGVGFIFQYLIKNTKKVTKKISRN